MEEQEGIVNAKLRSRGLRLLNYTSDARRSCVLDNGYAGSHVPSFVLHYATPDSKPSPTCWNRESRPANTIPQSWALVPAMPRPDFPIIESRFCYLNRRSRRRIRVHLRSSPSFLSLSSRNLPSCRLSGTRRKPQLFPPEKR